MKRAKEFKNLSNDELNELIEEETNAIMADLEEQGLDN
jgi:hypothetical protein